MGLVSTALKWLGGTSAGASVARPVLGAIGSAGLNYAVNKKGNKDAFRTRMEMGEKYGIHPLQMLGSAGNFSGQGGLNVGSQMISNFERSILRKQADETHDAQIFKMISEAEQATANANYLNSKALDPDDPSVADENPDGGHSTDELIFDRLTGDPDKKPPGHRKYNSASARREMRTKQLDMYMKYKRGGL